MRGRCGRRCGRSSSSTSSAVVVSRSRSSGGSRSSVVLSVPSSQLRSRCLHPAAFYAPSEPLLLHLQTWVVCDHDSSDCWIVVVEVGRGDGVVVVVMMVRLAWTANTC